MQKKTYFFQKTSQIIIFSNMCVLFFLFVTLYGLFALNRSFQVERFKIISFRGEPLEIPVKNNEPDFSRVDIAIRKEVKEAWQQYLVDLNNMRQMEKKKMNDNYEMQEYLKLEKFKQN